MPLNNTTFSGLDLTTMEVVMHQLAEQHRLDKREAFKPHIIPSQKSFLSPKSQTQDEKRDGQQSAEKLATDQEQGSRLLTSVVGYEAGNSDSSELANQATQTPGGLVVQKMTVVSGENGPSQSVVVVEGNIEGSTVPISPLTSPVTQAAVSGEQRIPNGVSTPQQGLVHEGFSCDGCGGPVIGTRFHCME
jgi:hypothetical protein